MWVKLNQDFMHDLEIRSVPVNVWCSCFLYALLFLFDDLNWWWVGDIFWIFLAIQNKYCDWKGFLVKVLTGARTLPQNFKSKVADETSNWPLKPNMVLEVVDRLCLSTMKVATVDEVIGGRLKLKYTDSKVRRFKYEWIRKVMVTFNRMNKYLLIFSVDYYHWLVPSQSRY